MAKATYIVTNDFKTPYVRSTGNPRNPTEVKFKTFKKGEMIAGELKHANNKPAFVLFNGVCVVPLSVVKAVVTKEIVSSATGASPSEPLVPETTRQVIIEKNPKTRYVDAAIVGALVGLGGVFLANKKGWIAVPAKINYAYGAGIGALAAAYFIYRSNNKPKKKAL